MSFCAVSRRGSDNNLSLAKVENWHALQDSSVFRQIFSNALDRVRNTNEHPLRLDGIPRAEFVASESNLPKVNYLTLDLLSCSDESEYPRPRLRDTQAIGLGIRSQPPGNSSPLVKRQPNSLITSIVRRNESFSLVYRV
jgi:hypothetical protein